MHPPRERDHQARPYSATPKFNQSIKRRMYVRELSPATDKINATRWKLRIERENERGRATRLISLSMRPARLVLGTEREKQAAMRLIRQRSRVRRLCISIYRASRPNDRRVSRVDTRILLFVSFGVPRARVRGQPRGREPPPRYLSISDCFFFFRWRTPRTRLSVRS